MRAILHFDRFDSVSCIAIPLGACIAAAKAGYPPSGFPFRFLSLVQQTNRVNARAAVRNLFDPSVVYADEPRINGLYMIHFWLCRRIHKNLMWDILFRCKVREGTGSVQCGKVSNLFHPFEMIFSQRLYVILLWSCVPYESQDDFYIKRIYFVRVTASYWRSRFCVPEFLSCFFQIDGMFFAGNLV